MSPLACGWIPHCLPSTSLPPSLGHCQPICSLVISWHATRLHLLMVFYNVQLHIWIFLYKLYTSVTGFLNIITIDIWSWVGAVPCVAGSLAALLAFTHPMLVAAPSPPIVTTKNVSRHRQMSLAGGGCQISPCSTRTQKVKSILKPVIYILRNS